MSLRNAPVERAATLPDGRVVVVRVGVPDDPYVPKRELSTVTAELFEGDRPLAVATTLLEPDDVRDARELAQEIAGGLEDGSLEPTAAAIEPLADRSRG
jgi:trimethylamine:corrinoid methyltransferase-like protein